MLKEGSGFGRHHTGQRHQGDQVREGHQCIKDIRDGPHRFHRHERPDKDRQHIQHAIGHHRLVIAVRQVFQAAFAVIIPAENGRKGEEHQTDHQQKARHLRREGQPVLEGADRHVHPFEALVPGAGENDRKACHRADHDGIDKGARHRNEPLAHTGFGLSRRGRDRRRAQSRFIGENPPGDPLLHRHEIGRAHV